MTTPSYATRTLHQCSSDTLLSSTTTHQHGDEASQWREWTTSSISSINHNPFRVMDWNILAPQYVDQNRYSNIASALLEWNNRREVILNEIIFQNPDIVALQEVDEEAYYSFLHPKLIERGYFGFFLPKTRKLDSLVDGVALFWNSRRFSLIETEAVSFKVGGIMDRHQVAQLAVLEDLLQQERLIIANTHLSFNLKRCDIKLGQLLLMMGAVWNAVRRHSTTPSSEVSSESFKEVLKKEQSLSFLSTIRLQKSLKLLDDTPGVLLCGDFNFTPYSHLYQWVRDGCLDFSTIRNERHISGQDLMCRESSPLDPLAYNRRGGSVTLTTNDKNLPTQGKNKSKAWLHNVLNSFDSSIFVKPMTTWIHPTVIQSVKYENNSNCLNLDVPSSPHCNDQQRQRYVDYLYHPFICQSAYAIKSPSGEVCEPHASAFHGWQKGVVDYIWYSSNELKVSKMLQLPSVHELKKIGNIPHEKFPGSDHFNLVVDFEWTPKTNRKVAVILT